MKNPKLTSKSNESETCMLEKEFGTNLIKISTTLEANGKKFQFKATVDTGSTRSCIAKKTIERWDNNVQIRRSDTKLIIANGEENDSVIGEVTMNAYFKNGLDINSHRFIVIKNLPVDVLIGLDLIAEMGILQIDAVDRIALDENEVIMLNGAVEERNDETDKKMEIPESIFEGAILNEREKETLRELLLEYADIMAASKKEAVCSKYEATIPMLEGSKPFVRIKPYPIPVHYKERCMKEIKKWENDGIIEPCQSPFNAPILCVEKKLKPGQTEPDLRVCVDYRGLNELVASDPFIPARLGDIFAETEPHRYRSAFDLPSAYLQIPIKREDRYRTAFIAGNQQYQFTKMPFGLKNSGTAFERMMALVMEPLDCKSTKNYVDDVCITNMRFDDHVSDIRRFFDQIRKFGLKLSYEKMNLGQKSILFVGFELSEEGFKINQKKRDGINQISELESKKDVRSFLGMVNFFRSFIPACSERTKHLSSSIQEQGRFEFTPEMRCEVEDIKEVMNKEPVLAYPDLSPEAEPFEVYTDASQDACAFTIVQERGGKRRIIDGGAKFNKTQKNYCIFKKEFFAVKLPLKRQRHILAGRRFKLYTDSQAVYDCLKPKVKENNEIREFPSPVIARWAMFILSFDFELIKIKSEENVVADCLSRLSLKEELENKDMDTTLMICECEKITGNCGKELGDQRFNGKVDMGNLMRLCHDRSGHIGFDKTLKGLRNLIQVPGDRDIVKKWINTCQYCQKFKHSTVKGTQSQITDRPRATRAMERVQVDLHMVGNTSKQGFKWIMGIIDEFSWYGKFYPLKNKCSKGTANKMIQFLQAEGAGVREIKTDFGMEFFGDFTSRLEGLGLIIERATPLHKNKNCQVERAFGLMKNILSAVMYESEKTSWVNCLVEANLLYNAIPHVTTGLSPYQIVFGHTCREAEHLMHQFDESEINDMVKLRWDEWSSKNHKEPDIRFEVGDQVLIKRQQTPENGLATKYGQKFIGPFELLDKINAATFIIEKDRTKMKVNVAQMRMYHERTNQSFLARKISGARIRLKERNNALRTTTDVEGKIMIEGKYGLARKNEGDSCENKARNENLNKVEKNEGSPTEKTEPDDSHKGDETPVMLRVVESDDEAKTNRVTWRQMTQDEKTKAWGQMTNTMTEDSRELFDTIDRLREESVKPEDMQEVLSPDSRKENNDDFYIGDVEEEGESTGEPTRDTLGKLKEIQESDVEMNEQQNQDESESESEDLDLDELSDSEKDREIVINRNRLPTPLQQTSTPATKIAKQVKSIGWSPVCQDIQEEPQQGRRAPRLRQQPRVDYRKEKISGN